jgi:hypothetical protein
MKTLFALLAFAIVGAAPASARPARTAHLHASRQERPSMVHPHDANAYQRPWIEENNNLNPDFQLGGSW